jgi:proline racemase
MRIKHIISVIDSHTAGEPTRIIVDGERYYNMCGHASIGICAMLVETGRVKVMPLHTVVRLETPIGIVEGTVTMKLDGKVEEVSLVGVPSFAWVLNKKIEVPSITSPVLHKK